MSEEKIETPLIGEEMLKFRAEIFKKLHKDKMQNAWLAVVIFAGGLAAGLTASPTLGFWIKEGVALTLMISALVGFYLTTK